MKNQFAPTVEYLDFISAYRTIDRGFENIILTILIRSECFGEIEMTIAIGSNYIDCILHLTHRSGDIDPIGAGEKHNELGRGRIILPQIGSAGCSCIQHNRFPMT